MKMNKVVLLPWNDSFGGGDYYELVEFMPRPDHAKQEGCYLLKPVSKKPDFKKMTKVELIAYTEEIDSRLVEMFEYNLGVDLRDPKHQGFIYELADYFKALSEKAIRDFYSGRIEFEPPSTSTPQSNKEFKT